MSDFDRAREFFFEGIAFMEKEDFCAAEQAFRKALELAPGRVSVIVNLTAVLIKLNKINAATEYARQSIQLDSDNAHGLLNLGLCLMAAGQNDDAITQYEKALAVAPEFEEIWMNRGMALGALRRYGEALTSFDQALALKPNYAQAWFNRAMSLLTVRPSEVLSNLEKALSINPEIGYGYGSWLSEKMKVCDWAGIEQAVQHINDRVRLRRRVVSPFAFLGMSDLAADEKTCAEIFVADGWRPEAHPVFKEAPNMPGELQRLKIGYFSADFHNHATSQLMVELFERHDRSRFELFAFSFGPDIRDEMRLRVSTSFDHFIDVNGKSDDEVASLSRDLGMHIAIDLKGYTQESRPQIFAYGAAPIQVNYLGYPGTMGMESIDYVIADHTLIGCDDVGHYTEKVVFMPHSYQVNDSARRIAPAHPGREALGLPQSGFVFACFNNNYKFTSEAFDIWMRLLNKVPGSVLWLFRSSETASDNLRTEAQARGVAPYRLVFADRMNLPDHLARHRAADLFLDTFYYNAHTTASDALWAGLPVLTLKGNTFSARVAASLLNAIGLPELITHTPEEYESLALELATKPEMLAAIKEKLDKNRLTHPLFDAELFARHVEKAYELMWDRHQQGLAPDHIHVPA